MHRRLSVASELPSEPSELCMIFQKNAAHRRIKSEGMLF
jgi:hypothetical protein